MSNGLKLGQTGTKHINKKLALPGTAPTAADTTGEVGDMIVASGTLYICTAKDSATKVATWYSVALTEVV